MHSRKVRGSLTTRTQVLSSPHAAGGTLKAFLSHSSSDAEFVTAVANELGRQYTWLDTQAFTNGDELLAGLDKGLSESGVFALFVSRASLQSLYVAFEIAEARQLKVIGSLQRILVYVLDPAISLNSIPKWLTRGHVSRADSSKGVARSIRHALDQEIAGRHGAVFVGRTSELASAERRLLPTDGSPPPRQLYIAGLPGVGRRTVLQRLARDHWRLSHSITIRIETTDNLADIGTKLADKFEPYNTVAAFGAIAANIARENQGALLNRLSTYLSRAVESQELIVFLDDGGLLTNDGALSDVAVTLLSLIQTLPSLYVGFISTRRPTGLLPHQQASLAELLLPALIPQDSKQLVAALLGRANLRVSGEKLGALAGATAGYPPSAYQLIEMVKQYGVDVALTDASRFASSRYGPMAAYLRKVFLSSSEKGLLRLLATSSPLPLPVLGAVCGLSPRDLTSALIHLIDVSLLLVDDVGEYWIASPVADLIARDWGEVDKNTYARLADELDAYIGTLGPDVPRLSLARVLFRAHQLADDDAHRASSFNLASDLLSVAERMYHRRDYRRAVDLARAVIEVRPRNYDARYHLSRALIKSADFEEADVQIEQLARMGYKRESSFLAGFLERHRNHPKDALKHYERALSFGYGGLSIHREMAQCCLALEDLAGAKAHLTKASRSGTDNPYILDLYIVIAAKEGNEAEARQRLAQLELVDESAFYYHRLSTVESAFGHVQEALSAARSAIAESGRPTFAMLAQLVVAETRAKLIDEAEKHLGELARLFPNQSKDVQIGLKSQLEVARGHFEEALSSWELLSDKRKGVHIALKRNALRGILAGPLPDSRRISLRMELEKLEESLSSAGEIAFNPLL
jgi:tetratricopeptide (TPR) repeat protein